MVGEETSTGPTKRLVEVWRSGIGTGLGGVIVAWMEAPWIAGWQFLDTTLVVSKKKPGCLGVCEGIIRYYQGIWDKTGGFHPEILWVSLMSSWYGHNGGEFQMYSFSPKTNSQMPLETGPYQALLVVFQPHQFSGVNSLLVCREGVSGKPLEVDTIHAFHILS